MNKINKMKIHLKEAIQKKLKLKISRLKFNKLIGKYIML